MLNPGQFIRDVIRPTLKSVDLWSPWAERLLFGTAIQESGLVYLRQLNNGPALGVYQMEPATHDDIWNNYLRYRPVLNQAARRFSRVAGIPGLPRPEAGEMVTNLAYATVMCRLHYYRSPVTPIDMNSPERDANLAKAWKRFYNTAGGKGTEAQFLRNLEHFPYISFLMD